MRRGTARAFDHAQLVHAQWLHIIRLNIQIFVKRVRSKDNIADLPSRQVSVVMQIIIAISFENTCGPGLRVAQTNEGILCKTQYGRRVPETG